MSRDAHKVTITKYCDSEANPQEDYVAEEEPLQITLDGVPIAVVMRTGGHDLDLVLGFLRTEGIIDEYDSIRRVDLERSKNHALVFLEDDVEVDYERLKRNLYSASSCGICGKATIDSVCQSLPKVAAYEPFTIDNILAGPELLRSSQDVFEQTGGLHAAGLIDRSGTLLVVREDVGRHNAIDKVLGWAWREGVCLEDVFLQVSGRVSFEVVQKALAAGVTTVSAISAPTSLAVEFTQKSGQTLVGFVRTNRLNLYAGELLQN